MKKKNSQKRKILNFLNDLLWYTQATGKDFGMQIPSPRLSAMQMEELLTSRYWLIWDIKNFVETELYGEKNHECN